MTTHSAQSPQRQCPTCRAPFRGARRCPRCGTDLTDLMRLLVHATRLRNAARAALASGDTERAVERATRAAELACDAAGRRLLAVARLCQAAAARRAD